MVREIKDMGFDRIELNFTLTYKDICDIISIKDKEGIEVTSLHNFCPIPKGVSPKRASPDYYSLSSLDEDERKRAIENTKVTIETAHKLYAPVVILHAGRVAITDRTRELAEAIDDKESYERIKDLMIKERSRESSKYFDKVISSIEELLSFAEENNVILGIENRYYHSEIPSIDEMGILFERFSKNDYIGYWHDTGHAQIFQNIGLHEHKVFLDRFAAKMIGIHLHDVTGIADHKAPLQGDFDFSMLKPYLKKDTLLVLEPHFPATSLEIKKGVLYLRELFEN